MQSDKHVQSQAIATGCTNTQEMQIPHNLWISGWPYPLTLIGVMEASRPPFTPGALIDRLIFIAD